MIIYERKLVRVLALDTSTHTGYAFDNPEGNGPLSGVQILCGWKPRDVDKSYAKLMDLIERIVAGHAITHVVIERPFNVYAHTGFGKSKSAGKAKDPDLANALLGFVAVAGGMAQRLGCDVSTVSPSTVRKHFIGNGAHPEPKLAVQRRCRALGWPAIDDNAADALATWDYAKSVLDPGWASRSTPLFARAPA